MDFFKEYSDLSNTPVYSKYNQSPAIKNKKLQTGSNKGANDDLDDLLSDLMGKQQLKKSRKDNNQPYSSQHLGFNHIQSFNKTHQPMINHNAQSDINYNYNNLSKGGNKGSRKSILDELMSQDNQSYKSGVTGRRDKQLTDNNVNNKNNQLTNQIQPFQPGASQRTGMRPLLKKKVDSRQPSIYNDDKDKNNDLFMSEQNDRFLNTPLIFRNQTMKQTTNDQRNLQTKIRFDLSNSKQKPNHFQTELVQKPIQMPVVQQKIIQKIFHVKEENTQLALRYQQQIKLIKQSYQRQMNNLMNNYQKIIKDEQNHRKNVHKTYQQNIDIQKRKWQKLISSQTERIKSLYDWQSKKKTQSYQLQINKLKGLIQTITKVSSKNNSDNENKSLRQQSQFLINLKYKQLQKQKQKVQNQKSLIQIKKRQFQSEQYDFQMYKKKQEDKINQQRKKLFQYQTQIRKREIQIKKQSMTEKQSISAQLVNAELVLNHARENLRYEEKKFKIQKELFIQQKQQYQKINNKILSDLKDRHRGVQREKEQLQNLQIQLYKKINTIQMMAADKGIITKSNQISLNGTLIKSYKNNQGINRSISHNEDPHKQNYRNRVNSELINKIADTQSRYAQMQQELRNNSVRKESINHFQQPKINLEKYMQKLGRQKLKIQKY